MPKKKDVAASIALVEWVVSSKLVHAFTDERLSGAKFRPVLDVRNPVESSRDWHQLEVVGSAGAIAKETLLGIDPFSPSGVDWRCPSGHSVAAQILSEVYLNRDAWDGSDIAATTSLFGQGMNLLRPTPVLFISQRAYSNLQRSGLKGYSVEVAHLL